MLASFVFRRTFNLLRVTLHVDCERKDAGLAVTYDRRIVRVWHPVPFHEVADPDLAGRFLSRPVGERGSFLESLEHACRTGIVKPDKVGA